MMSRVNCRSSPSPRWRTFSSSSDHRTPQTSQILVHQNSFKHKKQSDFQQDNYQRRQLPVPSHRPGFSADIARQRSNFPTASSPPPRDFRSERQPSLSSRNQKSVESGSFSKVYYKPLRDNAVRATSSTKQFQSVLKNNDSRRYFSGVKRPGLKDFVDFPPAKQQKRNIEDRQDVSHQSRSLNLSSSNVEWCRPPCRQRTRSRDRKPDSISHGSHAEKLCPDRDSTLNQRRGHINLKTPCKVDDGHDVFNSKDTRGQDSTSWRQFPSDKRSSNLEISRPWSGVQHSPSRLHKKSEAVMTHHQERRNSSESRKDIRHSKCADQSQLHHKLSYRNEISSTQSHRYQENNYHPLRQKSPTSNNRSMQDDHRHEGNSFCSEHDSFHKTKTIESQRKHGSYEGKPRDNVRQDSRNSRSRQSSSIDSLSEVDCSWPNIVQQERSGSQSVSSVKSRKPQSLDKVTSTASDGSVDSQFSRSDVKAKVPEFNADYVVIIRRRNEGERPLCMREEFSGQSSPPINNDEHVSVAGQNVNSSDRSTSSLIVPVDKIQKVNQSYPEFSPAAEDSSLKSTQVIPQVEEKAEKVAATFHKPCRTVTNTTSMLTKKDGADERFVRTRPGSLGEQIGQEKTDRTSKSTEEATLTSKKSAYDLRQKISERRQLMTGRNTSTKIVRPWPTRWKNLPQTSFRNLVYGSRATERKHSFAPRK